MFCDKNLMNSEMLGKVWKLAHNMPTENMEEANLPKICKELDSWVTSESVMASRRLSLRASSNLIGGAAKLYKLSLDKLYDDVNKMNEDIIYRRKRGRDNSSLSESNVSSSESTIVPEQMRQLDAVGFADSSFSPAKRFRTEPAVKMTQRITMSRSPSVNDNVVNCNEEPNHEQSSNNGNLEHTGTNFHSSDVKRENDEEEPLSGEENPESKCKNQGVQTSPILTSRHRQNRVLDSHRRIEHGFDKNLPFGFILIHDTYGSRIPSKIIFTSINSNINNLF